MSSSNTPTTLSSKDVMAGFNIAHMTLYHWRQGTATKDPLPCDVDGRSVSFNLKKVQAWAKKHEVPFTLPKQLSVPGRPGPKTAPTKKAAPKKVAKPVVKKKATALKQKKAPVKRPVAAEAAAPA